MDNRMQAIDSAVRNHDGSWAAAAVAFDAGVSAERERCAKLCEDIQAKAKQWGPMAGYCAETIRAGIEPPCCAGGPQWGHDWDCKKCPD